MSRSPPEPQAPRQGAPPAGWKVGLASLLCLAAVSYVDYVTGYESRFFIFYFIPVGACGWYWGRVAALVMALFSGASWLVVDVLSDHYYPHELIRYWNGFVFFVAFAIIGVGLHHLKRSWDAERKARQELERALAELQDSTREIRELQSQLQVVCAWTHRIRLQGKWVTLDEFLTDKLNVKISHGISPEALAQVKQELGKGISPEG